MKLQVIDALPLAYHAVVDSHDVADNRPWLFWGTFQECAHYIAKHNPQDLTEEAIEALNAESGPVHMGEPVFKAIARGEERRAEVQQELRTATDKLFEDMDFSGIEQRVAAHYLGQGVLVIDEPAKCLELGLRADYYADLAEVMKRPPRFADHPWQPRRVGMHPALGMGYAKREFTPGDAKALLQQYREAYGRIWDRANMVSPGRAVAHGRFRMADPQLQNIPLHKAQEPVAKTLQDSEKVIADMMHAVTMGVAAELQIPARLLVRPLNKMELHLLDWWREHRPVYFDSANHVMEPTVNCNTATECKMATMAAELFCQACEDGRLGYEAPVQPDDKGE